MPTTRSRGSGRSPAETSHQIILKTVKKGRTPMPAKVDAPSLSRESSPLSNIPSDLGTDNDDRADIEGSLKRAITGVSSLRKQIKRLQSRNDELQAEVARLNEAEDISIQPKRGGGGGIPVQALNARVRKLNNEVAKLELARQKDRRKIQKLKMKEIQQDAAELQDEMVNGVGDTAEKMRKLLRRFYHHMTSPSLEEAEECSVCMMQIELETALSLSCQHVFCKDCLSKIKPPVCPACREPYESDLHETERVRYTATEQWDALLEIAQDWAAIDRHGGEDEPEHTEEEGEPFITDGDPNASSAASEPDATMEDPPTDEDEGPPARQSPSMADRSTPPPTANNETSGEVANESASSQRALSYHQSPAAVKRKRLEELAESRRPKPFR